MYLFLSQSMNHLYGVNKYTYAWYCTETDLFKKLSELDPDPEPDPDLVVKFPGPDSQHCRKHYNQRSLHKILKPSYQTQGPSKMVLPNITVTTGMTNRGWEEGERAESGERSTTRTKDIFWENKLGL